MCWSQHFALFYIARGKHIFLSLKIRDKVRAMFVIALDTTRVPIKVKPRADGWLICAGKNKLRIDEIET